MNYPGNNGFTSMMGTGYLGETRTGPDGNLYQWVEGIDGLGNPIGFWNKFRKAYHAARRVAQYHPAAQALRLVSSGVSGYEGLGALYQAPDGSMYQMQGVADEALQGLGQGLGADALTQIMGIGQFGEVRQGPDGRLYQWVQGVDGLGNPIGSWRSWRKRLRGLVKTALPFAQKIAPFIPGGSAVLTAATPILQQAGVAGYGGLGTLHQAPDGTLYQMQGYGEGEDMQGYGEGEALYGYGEGEDLQGYGEGEDMQGYGEGESLYGYGEGEDMRGYGEGEALYGYGEGEDMQGYGEGEDMQGIEGYIRQNGMSGLGKYVPQQPPMTPGVARTQTCWNPPW
jgi:hypothetical protein